MDYRHEPESEEGAEAFLDMMVRELGCRMFTQLTLRGMVRWQAIEPFTESLHPFEEFRRTPWDRTRFLEHAEAKLLRAIAEDHSFDLAFCNLCILYTKLREVARRREHLALVDQRRDLEASTQSNAGDRRLP